MPSNHIRTFHLICHFIVYFSKMICTLQAYNESIQTEFFVYTKHRNKANFTQHEQRGHTKSILSNKVVVSDSEPNDSKFLANAKHAAHKLVFLNHSSSLDSSRSNGTVFSDVNLELYSTHISNSNEDHHIDYKNDEFDSKYINISRDEMADYTNSVFKHFNASEIIKHIQVRSLTGINRTDDFPTRGTTMDKKSFSTNEHIDNNITAFPVSLSKYATSNLAHNGETVNEDHFPEHVNSVSEANDSLPDWNNTNRENNSHSGRRKEHAPVFSHRTLLKCIVLLSLGGTAVFGNVATLLSIIRRGRQNSSTVYLLLVHLSVADLMVTWFCIVGEGVWTLAVQWYAGNVFCKFFKFLQMLALYLSTFILVVIGFDRLCAVRFPMKRIKARHQVQRSVAVAWTLSCLLSAPQALIFRVVKGPFIEEFYQCVTYGFYTAAWQEQLYTSVSLLCMFLIPLCVLVTTYAATFATIASKNRVFGGTRNPFIDARCKMLHKAKVKSLWITVVIVSTFIVCWTPYYISMIISVFLDPDDQLGQGLHDIIFFFGSSTAVLNPIIYGAFHLRRASPSNRNSSKYEASVALSTLRKVRYSNGLLSHRESNQEARRMVNRGQRRATQESHVEFF